MARPRKYPLPVAAPPIPEGVFVDKLSLVTIDWSDTLREHDVELLSSQAAVTSGAATIDDVSYSDGITTVMLTPHAAGDIWLRVAAAGSDRLTRSRKVLVTATREPAVAGPDPQRELSDGSHPHATEPGL